MKKPDNNTAIVPIKLKLGCPVEVNGNLTLSYSGEQGRLTPQQHWVVRGTIIDIHRGIIAIKTWHDSPSFYYCREEDATMLERRKADRRAK